jgi:hypothetical protein
MLETVNNLRAHSLGFHLQPVGWERVIPSFGRPQDLINLELHTADLVVVMFWNHIGSPSSKDSTKSGTVEEFELASRLYDRSASPTVWVYFKKPTAESDAQLDGVLEFRARLEAGKQIFFREFESTADWEEMFREHLVAYLDGLSRWNIDEHFQHMNPNFALMEGRFLSEGIGTSSNLHADLDGDGNDEIVSFWASHGGFSLTVTRFDKTLWLKLPTVVFEDDVKFFHLAIKDVSNDGLPEILLATWNGFMRLSISIWGFTEQGRTTRSLSEENFSLLAQLEGQQIAIVREGGTIILIAAKLICNSLDSFTF